MSDEGDYTGGGGGGSETEGTEGVETVETASEVTETGETELVEQTPAGETELVQPSAGSMELSAVEKTGTTEGSKPLEAPTQGNKELVEPTMGAKPLTETTEPLGAQPLEGLDSQYQQLETPRNGAYFYSGLGKEGDKVAAGLAGERGGTTLETKLSEAGIVMPEYNMNDKASMEAWREASRQYAARASGDVHVVAGERMTADGVFATVEYPTLQANEKVTRILSVDPKTGEETVVFDRANPEQNKTLTVYRTSTYEKKAADGTIIQATNRYVRFE